MTSTISVESKNEGSIAIPAKILLDILKTFPDHPLTFSFDEKMGIEISSDYGKYKLSGFSGEEFPKSPVIESPTSVHFDAHTDLLVERLGIDLCFGSWCTHILEFLPQYHFDQ